MAYTPNTWQSGDIVTSAKLNNIEQGIAGAGGALIVHADTTTQTLDTTYKVIHDTLAAGTPVYVTFLISDTGYVVCAPIVSAQYQNGTYTVASPDPWADIPYDYWGTDSETGYPQWFDPSGEG